jgi:lipopolysaccharide biosynthesis glycosyltransferase
MLTSLFENNKDNEIHLHFFSANFNTENKKIVEQTANKYQQQFSFYALEAELFKDCYVSDHVSFATYYRIVIPNILVNQTSKILYLDTDIVVCKNLKPLWEIKIDNYTIAAVNELNFDGPARLNFDEKYKYFNAGILLINAQNWVSQNLQETLFSYIKLHKSKLTFWDQDALNANLYNKRLTLEPQWNQLSPVFEVNNNTLLKVYSADEIKILKISPAIVHYSGSSKPWNYLNIHPFKGEYYKYLSLTDWRGFKPSANFKTKIKYLFLKLVGRNIYTKFFSIFQ